MEYSQLKEKYKFLGEILKFYDTLEEPVPANYLYQPILNLCDTGSLLQGDNAEKYIKFCKKISRNLLLLADLDYRGDIFIKYCGILYMWMYFEIIKNSIPNNIPEKIFYKLIEIIKDKLKKTPCPYINFNEKHHKPTKLIKLHIFNDNADTFQSMLKDVRKSDDCSLKRYIYKCIEIYRDMHSTYCSNGDDKIEGNKNSCEIINKFNRLYSSYINKKNGILHEFPELSSNTPLNVIVGCPLEESESNPIPDKSQQEIILLIFLPQSYIWNSCDFDKPVDYSQDNKQIIELCEKNETYKTNPTENYKNICNQLLNNLKILSNNSYSNTDTFITRCKNLNNWLYFKQNELSVSSDIISQIFQAYKQIKNEKYHTNDCAYSTFDNGFNEKEELINLRIFNDNGETIQALLKDSIKSKDCNLKKYVYECVDIYKEIKRIYSFPGDCDSSPYRKSCGIIKEFNKLYSFYIYNKDGILHNFPDLSSNTTTKDIEGCQAQAHTGDSALDETPQTGTSMKGAVSPALGFTPVRKFLSFRNNKNARAFSNLGEEVENELIIQQFEDTRINSVHPKYNVAYGQI
ncbi:hypothetical protein PVNG_03822 [Plasmodium vivax North Korean]|uniref:VIR protein n=1 Tax=Plasmodium vivax North Korean TaxID=1035514 RepID=A0A0J9WDB7_PLAVI|nr:hypothetical protein PVNG_03822 [Plasmodium vivax North Korean]